MPILLVRKENTQRRYLQAEKKSRKHTYFLKPFDCQQKNNEENKRKKNKSAM